MGFPPNSDHCITQAKSTGSLSFEMTAPHGARIMATMVGCRIDFAPEHREHVYAWLKSELLRLETFGATQEELVVCPDCQGKMKIVNGGPVFCTTCKGMGRVTKSAAERYKAAHDAIEVEPATKTDVQRSMFVQPAPLTMSNDGFPVAPTKVVVGKVQPEPEEDFVAPAPGQAGFIGPLQQ